ELVKSQRKGTRWLARDPSSISDPSERARERLEGYRDISKRKEQVDLDALNDTDELGPSASLEERAGKSDKRRTIARQLLAPVCLNFKDVEFGQVIDDLRDISGVNVVADTASLEDASVDLHRKMSLTVENVPMQSALDLLLQQVHLTYIIKDDVLQITTPESARASMLGPDLPIAVSLMPFHARRSPIERIMGVT